MDGVHVWLPLRVPVGLGYQKGICSTLLELLTYPSGLGVNLSKFFIHNERKCSEKLIFFEFVAWVEFVASPPSQVYPPSQSYSLAIVPAATLEPATAIEPATLKSHTRAHGSGGGSQQRFSLIFARSHAVQIMKRRWFRVLYALPSVVPVRSSKQNLVRAPHAARLLGKPRTP